MTGSGAPLERPPESDNPQERRPRSSVRRLFHIRREEPCAYSSVFCCLRRTCARSTRCWKPCGGTPSHEGRWSRVENLHVAHAFVGEVTPGEARRIAAALEGLEPVGLNLGLAQIGRFGRGTLWAALSGRDSWSGTELGRLAGRVRELLDRLGVAYDAKPFRAHVTLGARLARSGAGGSWDPDSRRRRSAAADEAGALRVRARRARSGPLSSGEGSGAGLTPEGGHPFRERRR